MSKSLGISVKLLHKAKGHIVTVELKSGEHYRGLLIECEDNWNCQLDNITYTARLEHVFIRGSKVRFMIIPDMLKNAPMFKRLDAKIKAKALLDLEWIVGEPLPCVQRLDQLLEELSLVHEEEECQHPSEDESLMNVVPALLWTGLITLVGLASLFVFLLVLITAIIHYPSGLQSIAGGGMKGQEIA